MSGAIIAPPSFPLNALESSRLVRSSAAFLPNLRAAINKVKAESADASILYIGDSLGFFGSAASGKSRYNGVTHLLAKLLTDGGINAVGEGFLGCGGGRGAASLMNQYDDRVSLGNFAETGVNACGGAMFVATGATSNFSTDFREQYDRYTVRFFQYSGSGSSFNWNLNGGSNTAQSVNGTNSVASLDISASMGFNTINLNWVGGTVWINGIDPWISTRKQLRLLNAAWSASWTTDWVTASSQSGVNTLRLGQAATIICLGANDMNNSISTATFMTNMNTLIDECKTQGDVILITPPQSDTGSYANAQTQSDYRNAVIQTSLIKSCGLVDAHADAISYISANGYGLFADGIHLNGVGQNALFAKGIHNLIGSL